MKKVCLILVMLICGVLCFAHLGFCVEMIMLGCSDSSLVGIASGTSSSQFVSINFSTGLLTLLNSNVSDASTNLAEGGGWGCVGGGTFYAIRRRAGNCYIIGINISTGALTESPALHF